MASQSASVEIALKPSNAKSLPSNIQAIIQNEYASRYLESIGANPSKENMELMLKSLPLKEALILPVWQREAIVIMPGIAKNADISSIMHQLVSSNLEKARGSTANEDGKQKSRLRYVHGGAAEGKETKQRRNVSFAPSLSAPKMDEKAKKTRRLSWCTVNTLDVLEPFFDKIDIRESSTNHFRNLLLPPGIIDDEITVAVRSFNQSLDGFLLDPGVNNIGVLFRSIRVMLLSNSCMRLYDVLCRFCYWNIIHPTARSIIISAKKIAPEAYTAGR